jgi:hypothetical protein
MKKWFQRTIVTAGNTETVRGTHKRQTIRDLHRGLKKAGLGATGDVKMYVEEKGDPLRETLIHQAEVTRRGRVKVLEL